MGKDQNIEVIDMALWNFRFYIFPVEGIRYFYNTMSSLLKEYNAYEDFEYNLIYNNYFLGNENILEDAKKYLNKNLNKNEYWDKDADSYIDEFGNMVNVYKDEIFIKLDLRMLNIKSIDKMLRFIIQYKVVIVIGKTGKIIPANTESLMDEIKRTKYYELANR